MSYSSNFGVSSLYKKEPHETTLLIDVGNTPSSLSHTFGNVSGMEVSSSLAGCRQFQYDAFFWNNNLYTFTTQNNAVGLCISYYNKTLMRMFMVVVPIFIPKLSVCTSQLRPTESYPNYTEHQDLIREFLYHLNLNFVDNENTCLLAQDWYGVVTGGQANIVFPLFSDTTYCPLSFQLSPNGKQIIFGPSPWIPQNSNGVFAYTFVPLDASFFVSSTPGLFSHPTRVLTTNPVTGAIVTVSLHSRLAPYTPNLSVERGWFGRGHTAVGIGQLSQNNASTQTRQYQNPMYPDSESLRDLFTFTAFPQTTLGPVPAVMTYGEYFVFSKSMGMTTSDTGYIQFSSVCSLLSSRFIVTLSNALTAKQQRPILSNNPTVARSNALGVHFNTLSSNNMYEDLTLTGDTVRRLDTPAIGMDSMYNIGTVDLSVTDEYGAPYITSYGADGFDNFFTLSNLIEQTLEEPVAPNRYSSSIPASYLAPPVWVPNASGATQYQNEAIFGRINLRNVFYRAPPASHFFDYGGNANSNTFDIRFPLQTEMTHFVRVVGMT